MAFESALHIFPFGPVCEGHDLTTWNSHDLWRGEYDDMADGHLFFAEDIFGEQFSVRANQIYRFDPETGQSEEVAVDVEQWARRVLQDYEIETGYPLAHAWQERYGPIPIGKRLIPKVPFVAGGEYELDNLYLGDAVQGMRSRANIARQIRDLPDGVTPASANRRGSPNIARQIRDLPDGAKISIVVT